MLARACQQALNKKVLVDTLHHEHMSPGARPDVAVIRGAHDRLHDRLLEVKVVSPLSSSPDQTAADGAYSAFANTAPDHRRHILGCGAVGNRAAVPAKYAGALEKGNTVTPCIFETFGGFEGSAVNLLNELSKAARAKTPPGQEPPGQPATSSRTGHNYFHGRCSWASPTRSSRARARRPRRSRRVTAAALKRAAVT